MISLAVAAALAAPALPDLEQVAPTELRVVEREGRRYLGFATAVRNVGGGALRLRGDGSGDGTMTVRQLSEDGGELLQGDVGRFRYVTTFGHRHWHYMGFMRYELRGLDEPGVLLDRKQGFCLGDAPFVSGWCARDQPALTATELGIRAGGIDVYEPNVEGQEIEVDRRTAPSGRYVLTSRIGPTGALRETRTDNNAASTVVRLRWPAGSPEVTPLGSCVGEGCAGAVPEPTPPRMTYADARRFARRALRRTFRRRLAALRVRCRPAAAARVCRIRARRGGVSFRGRVRVWYELEGAATRWYYSVAVVRRMDGCGCSRRIRRSARLGGTVGRRGRATSLLCRITPARRPPRPAG